ncbi:hypothetical protein ACNKHO_10320 [Shigella flexneri]
MVEQTVQDPEDHEKIDDVAVGIPNGHADRHHGEAQAGRSASIHVQHRCHEQKQVQKILVVQPITQAMAPEINRPLIL